MEQGLDLVNHAWDNGVLTEELGSPAPDEAFERLFGFERFLDCAECDLKGDIVAVEIGDLEDKSLSRIFMNEA